MDVARFGEWATRSYTNEKVRENYARRFSIRFPNEELPAARPQQTTPLYDLMLAQGAVMGDSWGLETPRSEEHTSELQSLMRTSYAVLRLKKKRKTDTILGPPRTPTVRQFITTETAMCYKSIHSQI